MRVSTEHQKRHAYALQDLERYNSKLDELEQRVHAALSKNSGSEELHKLETRLASVHSGGGGDWPAQGAGAAGQEGHLGAAAWEAWRGRAGMAPSLHRASRACRADLKA